MSIATGALEIVALPAVLLVVAVKLAVTATEILELVAGEIPEVMIGGVLDVTNGGILNVMTDGALEVMISGALEVITGGVLKVTTGGALDVMTVGALEVINGRALEVMAAVERVGISFEISGTVTPRIVPSIVIVAIMVIELVAVLTFFFWPPLLWFVYVFVFLLCSFVALFLFRKWFIGGSGLYLGMMEPKYLQQSHPPAFPFQINLLVVMHN